MGFGMMNGTEFMGGWGGMAFGGLMMVFWFVLIVLAVRWIGGTSGQNSSQSAVDILEQRYARGEIDAAELEKRSRQLSASS